VVIHAFSRMQKCVTLSVTEAEYVAAVEVVQNMLFAWRVLQSIGVQVKTPMVIEIDNKGAVDLAVTPNTQPIQKNITATVAVQFSSVVRLFMPLVCWIALYN
jgi:hypothetical protein